MNVIQSILGVLNSLFAGSVLILLILVVVDLVLGVMASLKTKEFKWDKVSEFYKTKIIPSVGGWMVLVLAAKYAVNSVVPGFDGDLTYNGIFAGAVGMAWATIVRDLFYSLAENFCTVFGLPLIKKPASAG
jgi:phage-related holin